MAGELDAAAGRRDQAHHALERRGLAGAVPAEQRQHLALPQLERNLVEDVALAVEGVDAGDSKDGGPGEAGRGAAGVGEEEIAAVAEIDLVHFRVLAHLGRRPVHDHAPLVHHRDAVGEGEDAVDVVLDQQDGHPLAEPAQQRGDPLALGCGEAGERLVEQQHAGAGRQRQPQLEQPLAAIGEARDGHGLEAFEAEESNQRAGLLVHPCEVRERAPAVEAPRIARLDGQAQVLEERERGEEIGDLKRTCDAAAHDALGGQAVDAPAVEENLAAVGREHARDGIEERGLSRAIGADERVEPPVGEGEVHGVHRREGADSAW